MEQAATGFGAFCEAIVFLDYFKDLPDRRQRGKVVYPLEEKSCCCACRPFRGRTPSHDHLGDMRTTS